MNSMDSLFWIQRMARQRFNSAEADFEQAHRNVLDLERMMRPGYSIRQAHSHVYFAAHHLLRAAREMQQAGLSPAGPALSAARTYLSPEAEAERRKRLGL